MHPSGEWSVLAREGTGWLHLADERSENSTGMPVSAVNQCIDASVSGGLDTDSHRAAHWPITRLSIEASAKIDVLAEV